MNAHIPDEKTIFEIAFRIEKSDVREAYLDQICGENASLRSRVHKLLRMHEEDPDFLADSPVSPGATIDPPGPIHVGTQIGPYKFREQIGEGGMGEVYVAEQTEPVRRKVALKIIRPGMATKDVVARFETERQALAMMDHPNIARIFDGGATESGQPYFVMELVLGVPITDYCDEHQLSTRQRLELFLKICQAVHHAHQKGIIHRDIKPGNVLVAEIDGAAVLKVIDFGVAKAIDQKLTKESVYTNVSQMIGTPLYMSPEQATLGVADVDTRSDVYSLGVLLYELLTGHTPFDRDALKEAGFEEMQRIIREDEPPRPSARVSTLKADALSTVSQKRRSDPRRLGDALRGELDWIVMKCLEKDRGRRYESAAAVAADVQNYLDGAPVLACPPTVGYRLRKLASQHRAALAFVASIVLALSVGIGIALWQAAVARDNARRATQVAIGEREARQQAQANLQLAIEVVNDMYQGLATEWVSSDKALTDLQYGYLQKAVAFYDRLLENPAEYQLTPHQTAQVAWRSSLILRKMDERKRARERLAPAAADYAQALETSGTFPSSGTIDESLELLTDMHNLAGVLAQETGDLEQAVQSFAWANAVCEQLADRPSAATAARLKMANVATNLATVYERQGELDRAERSLQKALEIFEQVDVRETEKAGHNANYLGAKANMAALLLSRGKPGQAETLARETLRATQLRLMVEGSDNKPLRQVQVLLLENLGRGLFQQQRFAEAETMLEELLKRQVALLSIGTEPPIYTYAQLTGKVDQYPGFEEPEKWSDWIRGVLMLAEVKLKLGQPVAADDLVSRVMPVAIYLQTLYKDSPLPRHSVDEAHLLALTAAILQSRRADEACGYAALAADRWREVLSRFPYLEKRTSALWPDQSDFERFVEHFPDFDPRVSEYTELNAQIERRMSLQDRGRALTCIEVEDWASAEHQLSQAVTRRTPVDPYDLLTLSLALAKMDRMDEARARHDEAMELLGPASSLEPVVAERREQVTSLLDAEVNEDPQRSDSASKP